MALGRANALTDDLVSLAMEEGFDRSLLELAKVHENKTGLWLDNIEAELLATLKGSLAANAGVRADADPVRAATDQLTWSRERIADCDNNF